MASSAFGRTGHALRLLFQPAGCPRCESAAQEFEKAFRQVLPSERLVLWCAHGDAEAARRYARREGLRADTLVVDTAGVWRRVFSLNHEGLNGIFLLKMAVGSGRMLTGGELSYVDDDLFRELALSRLPLPFHSYGDDAVGADRASIAEVPGGGPLRYERWPLLTEGQAVLSWLREPPVLRNGRLLVNDNLENAGFMFRLDPAARAFRLEHVLRVDTAVRDTFVDLPPRIYDQVHRQFRYMVCGLSFVNDDTVAFSYSLPRAFVERRTGDNVNLAFYNEPVILSWQVEPFRTLPLTDLAAALQDAAYMNQHFAIYPYDGQHVAMACQQLTYPLFSVPDSLHGHPEYDPFVEAYYDRPHPYAVVVDRRTGAFVRRIGQLDDLMRRSRTGYGYALPVADSDGQSSSTAMPTPGGSIWPRPRRPTACCAPTTCSDGPVARCPSPTPRCSTPTNISCAIRTFSTAALCRCSWPSSLSTASIAKKRRPVGMRRTTCTSTSASTARRARR